MVKVGENEWQFAKKPTTFMTNSPHLAAELNVKCDATHSHAHLVDGRAARAAKYPEELCDAICRGIRHHLAHEQAELQERASDDAFRRQAGCEHGRQLDSLLAVLRPDGVEVAAQELCELMVGGEGEYPVYPDEEVFHDCAEGELNHVHDSSGPEDDTIRLRA